MGIFGREKTEKELYDYYLAKFEKGVKCSVKFPDRSFHTLIVKLTNKGIEMGSTSPDILPWEEIREIKPSQENVKKISIHTRSSEEFVLVTSASIPNNVFSKILNDRIKYELTDRWCPYCMHNPPIIANYCDECGSELPKWSKIVLNEVKSCFDGTEMTVSVGTTGVVNRSIPETKGHSGLSGALIGGLLLGPIGAVAGAAATRNKQTVYKNEEKISFVENVKGFSFVKCSQEGIFIKELDITLPWKEMASCKAISNRNLTIEMISGYILMFNKNVQSIRNLYEIYSPDEMNRLKLFKSQINKDIV